MCCVRNPRNINIFVRVPGREDSGSQPGGSVTGVTEKLFMCQMFMCLFWPLSQGGICAQALDPHVAHCWTCGFGPRQRKHNNVRDEWLRLFCKAGWHATPEQLSEPPKPREEQIPGKSMEKTLVEEVAVSISMCGGKSMRCADQRRFLQTTCGFLTKDIGLMSHSLRNPLQGISRQLFRECCRPYLSRQVSVG